MEMYMAWWNWPWGQSPGQWDSWKTVCPSCSGSGYCPSCNGRRRELIRCRYCGGYGQVRVQGGSFERCPRCGGSGYEELYCIRCHGSGACPRCGGRGYI